MVHALPRLPRCALPVPVCWPSYTLRWRQLPLTHTLPTPALPRDGTGGATSQPHCLPKQYIFYIFFFVPCTHKPRRSSPSLRVAHAASARVAHLLAIPNRHLPHRTAFPRHAGGRARTYLLHAAVANLLPHPAHPEPLHLYARSPTPCCCTVHTAHLFFRLPLHWLGSVDLCVWFTLRSLLGTGVPNSILLRLWLSCTHFLINCALPARTRALLRQLAHGTVNAHRRRHVARKISLP